nr:unnamed protein product [Digitaria exilis]
MTSLCLPACAAVMKKKARLPSSSPSSSSTGTNAFLPVRSSSTTTAKLYTSLLLVSWLVSRYSGSRYPKVPCTSVATAAASPAGASRDAPKSETFAARPPSRRMLADLTSRWRIGGDADTTPWPPRPRTRASENPSVALAISSSEKIVKVTPELASEPSCCCRRRPPLCAAKKASSKRNTPELAATTALSAPGPLPDSRQTLWALRHAYAAVSCRAAAQVGASLMAQSSTTGTAKSPVRLKSSAAAGTSPPAEAAEVGSVRAEPERDVALAAAVVAAARSRQRALGGAAHGHAPRDVVPIAVVEVGEAWAADGHELALHRREEERASVERHGLLLLLEVGVAGVVVVVAGAAGVEEHGGLGRGQRDGGDLVAVAVHGEARRATPAPKPEATRGGAVVAAGADAERVRDGHVAALSPTSRRLRRRRRQH